MFRAKPSRHVNSEKIGNTPSQAVARERLKLEALVQSLEGKLGNPETDSDELMETIVVLCHRLNNLSQRQMMLEAVGQ